MVEGFTITEMTVNLHYFIVALANVLVKPGWLDLVLKMYGQFYREGKAGFVLLGDPVSGKFLSGIMCLLGLIPGLTLLV